MGGWFGDEGVGFGSATFAEMRDRGLAREQPISIAPTPTLTPSEVALSKVLAALAAWGPVCGGKLSDADRALVDASKGIAAHGFWLDGDVTPTGAALLDRARKAGVL